MRMTPAGMELSLVDEVDHPHRCEFMIGGDNQPLRSSTPRPRFTRQSAVESSSSTLDSSQSSGNSPDRNSSPVPNRLGHNHSAQCNSGSYPLLHFTGPKSPKSVPVKPPDLPRSHSMKSVNSVQEGSNIPQTGSVPHALGHTTCTVRRRGSDSNTVHSTQKTGSKQALDHRGGRNVDRPREDENWGPTEGMEDWNEAECDKEIQEITNVDKPPPSPQPTLNDTFFNGEDMSLPHPDIQINNITSDSQNIPQVTNQNKSLNCENVSGLSVLDQEDLQNDNLGDSKRNKSAPLTPCDINFMIDTSELLRRGSLQVPIQPLSSSIEQLVQDTKSV